MTPAAAPKAARWIEAAAPGIAAAGPPSSGRQWGRRRRASEDGRSDEPRRGAFSRVEPGSGAWGCPRCAGR